MTIRDEFKDAAATFGADVERWPDHVRVRFSELIEHGDAAMLLRDAGELDRILSHAPGLSLSEQRQAADAILGAVYRTPEFANDAARAGMRGHPRSFGLAAAWLRRLADCLDWMLPAGGKWQSASVLAASLALGLALGATGRDRDEGSLFESADAMIVAETEIFSSESLMEDFDTVETSDEDDLL